MTKIGADVEVMHEVRRIKVCSRKVMSDCCAWNAMVRLFTWDGFLLSIYFSNLAELSSVRNPFNTQGHSS